MIILFNCMYTLHTYIYIYAVYFFNVLSLISLVVAIIYFPLPCAMFPILGLFNILLCWLVPMATTHIVVFIWWIYTINNTITHVFGWYASTVITTKRWGRTFHIFANIFSLVRTISTVFGTITKIMNLDTGTTFACPLAILCGTIWLLLCSEYCCK